MKAVAMIIGSLLLVACTQQKDNARPSEIPAVQTMESCLKNSVDCGSIDIDDPTAKEAYTSGCTAGDSYACYRLGQFFHTKLSDIPSAIQNYEKSCLLKYDEACKDEKKARSRLCYVEKQKQFCKGEPEGEFRTLVFLEKLDAKYKDALIHRDFSIPFAMDEVQTIYDRRLKEKNKLLLEALKLAKAKGVHDGADGEGLQDDIWAIEGKPIKRGY